MKRLFLILGIFLAINFEISAFTQKEKIQQTLSKLGVKQELINEYPLVMKFEIPGILKMMKKLFGRE